MGIGDFFVDGCAKYVPGEDVIVRPKERIVPLPNGSDMIIRTVPSVRLVMTSCTIDPGPWHGGYLIVAKNGKEVRFPLTRIDREILQAMDIEEQC